MKNFLLLILGIVIGALAMYFYCCQPNEDLAITTPKGVITPEQAKTLDEAYNARYKLISDSIVTREGGDNRSSWYSLDDMRNYLNYAEKQTKDMGYTMNGIRVYLGAYPDVREQVGYTTMFFIPTGYQAISKANMTFLNFTTKENNRDISEADGLNLGGGGDPPSASYPQ